MFTRDATGSLSLSKGPATLNQSGRLHSLVARSVIRASPLASVAVMSMIVRFRPTMRTPRFAREYSVLTRTTQPSAAGYVSTRADTHADRQIGE